MSKMRSWTSEQLIEALQNPDEHTGYAAAEELGRRRDKTGLKSLSTARWLADPDEDTPQAKAQVKAQHKHLQDSILNTPYQTSEALLEMIVHLAPYLYNRRLALCGLKGLGETGITSLIRFVEPSYKDIAFLLCLLADTGDERVIELLYDLLQKHPTLCLIALARMGQLGMQIIRQGLLCGDYSCRSSIVSYLTNVKDWEQHPAFVEAMLTLLQDEYSLIVILVIRRLGETGLPHLVPYLTPFCEDTVSRMKRSKHLGRLGPPKPLPPLQRGSSAPNEPEQANVQQNRAAWRWAGEQVGISTVAGVFHKRLCVMGQSNLIQQALQELTSSNYWQRMKAAQLISKFGDETHIEQVFNTFEFPPASVFNLKQFKPLEPPQSYPYRAYLHPIEPIVARCDVQTIPVVVPILLKLLRKVGTEWNNHVYFVKNALVCVSQYAIPELCQIAFYDDSERLRDNARSLLHDTDFTLVMPHLKMLWQQEGDWRKRVLIVLMVARDEHVDFLIDTLIDEEIVIQRTAITQLKKIATPEALAAVAAWERQSKQRSQSALPELCQIAFYDEHEHLRENAKAILHDTESALVMPHLKLLWQQEGDWRKRVLIVLFASDKSVDFLMDVLRDDEPVIQRTAITQLKKIATPEALAAVAAWEQRAR